MRRRETLLLFLVLLLAGVYVLQQRTDPNEPPSDRIVHAQVAPESAAPADAASRALNVVPRPAAPHAVSSDTMLPPQDAPIADVYDMLAARARNGDDAAAMRLVSDLQRCRNRAGSEQMIAGNLAGLREAGSNLDVDERARIIVELEQRADSLRVLCDGVAGERIEHRGEWLLMAASRGDPEAMACFVAYPDAFAPPFLSDAWFGWAPKWRDLAVPFALQAFAKGQADVLPLLADAYSGGLDKGYSWSNPVFAELVEDDFVRATAYAELARMKGLLNDAMVQSFRARLDEPARVRAQDMVDAEKTRFEAAPNGLSACSHVALGIR